MKKVVIWVLVVVLVLCVGIGIGLAVANNNKKADTTESKEKNTVKNELLQKKIEALTKEIAYMDNPLFTKKSMKLADFKSEDLETIAANNVKIYDVDEDFDEEKLSEDLEISEIVGYIKPEDLKKEYEYLFGKELKTLPKEISIGCPFGAYSTKDKLYYMSNACGGTGFVGEYIKQEKTEETDTQALIYVRYLYITPEFDDEGQEVDEDNYTVYKDYYGDKKKVDKISVDFEKVDDKYFEDAAQYVFVFDKKDNDYFFTEIRKIEQ